MPIAPTGTQIASYRYNIYYKIFNIFEPGAQPAKLRLI